MPDKKFIDTWGGQLGMSMAQNTANGLLGQVFGQFTAKRDDKRQLKQAGKLQALQIAGNKEMLDYQKMKDLEIWKATSYPGQLEMMEQAGLNPALMYGQGGGGGVTTGGTASVQGQSASARSEAIQGMGMMMQHQLTAAQIKNINADTKQKEVAAAKAAGADTQNVNADTANKILNNVILEYTGKEAKDMYERVNAPNRGVQQQALQYEYEARQGIANNIYELWRDGKLQEKSLAELEQILLQNSKSREETKQITKSIDLMEENLKGVKLDNIIKELETKLQEQTGIDKNSPWWARMLGRLFVNLMR